MKRKVYKFPSGATIVYQKDKRLNYSACLAGFISGSIKNEKNGVAHFVEHMMFKKTKNLTQVQIDKERSVITSINASTSNSRVLVDFSQTNRLFEKAMKLSSDLLLNSVYEDESIESEKRVIKEEYTRKLDKINQGMSFQVMYNFTNTLTPEESLGSHEDIEQITQEDLYNYKQKNFYQNNFIFGYIGNFGFRKVKKMVEKYFLASIETNKDYTNSNYPVLLTSEPKLVIYKNENKQLKVFVGFKYSFDEVTETDALMTGLMHRFFSHGTNQLRNKLRNEGLVYSSTNYACVYSNDYDNALFSFEFATSKEKLKRCIEVIKESITSAMNDPISDEDFLDIKNNKIYSYDEMHSPTKATKLRSMVSFFLAHGKLRDVIKTKKRIKTILKISKVDFQEYIKSIFENNHQPYVVLMGNYAPEELLTYEEICSVFK